MIEAERQALIRQYRIEALELIEPSLRVLEKWADAQPLRGAGGDDEDLLLYRRKLAKARIVATEVQNVMKAYRGKVGKTIRPEEFEALIEAALQRGHRKAAMAAYGHEPPKSPKLSEPK